MAMNKYKVVPRRGVNVDKRFVAKVQKRLDGLERLDEERCLKHGLSIFNLLCLSDWYADYTFWRDAVYLCTVELAEHTCTYKWCGEEMNDDSDA